MVGCVCMCVRAAAAAAAGPCVWLCNGCNSTQHSAHLACPLPQALDRGAALVGADKIATGHNADDVAETVLLNILRGDVPRCGLSAPQNACLWFRLFSRSHQCCRGI